MPADSLSLRIQKAIADCRPDEPIGPYTTVQVGGPARWMVFPTTADELANVLEVIRSEENLERTLVGCGANFFADSRGYDGLVINMTRLNSEFSLSDEGYLVVSGGANMRDVALECARRGWCGIDFMAVVPGTIGGAVAINAGTNIEGYIADTLQWVETLSYTGDKRRYSAQEMEFDYRTSRLLYGREIITRAAFQLVSCSQTGKSPADLLRFFEAAMDNRRAKFPLDLPNFGSTFRSPGAPHPPAGKLIDDLGMKGLRIGNAQISPMHGNFIVNLGGATSNDILDLMQHMHDAVLKRYGVSLRSEVYYLCNCDRPRPDFLASMA